MEIAILACGCFWDPEIKFGKLSGILKTEVGYCGGDYKNVSYKEVCEGNTNHAEVVKIEFDNNLITYEEILKFFFEIHDPTTLNQQGPDIGTQYRSVIFYTSELQKEEAKTSIPSQQGKWKENIVTEISQSSKFYRAEEYHQNYLNKNNISSCGL